jgi:hypothetical protein
MEDYMGKKRGQSYLNRTPNVIMWMTYQIKKHPEISPGSTLPKDLLELIDKYKYDRDFVRMPIPGYELKDLQLLIGTPNPPPDGSSYEDFLPSDWDAWLCYYIECLWEDQPVTIDHIVFELTDRIGNPLGPSEDPKENDEFNRVFFKVKNEFKKASKRAKSFNPRILDEFSSRMRKEI